MTALDPRAPVSVWLRSDSALLATLDEDGDGDPYIVPLPDEGNFDPPLNDDGNPPRSLVLEWIDDRDGVHPALTEYVMQFRCYAPTSREAGIIATALHNALYPGGIPMQARRIIDAGPPERKWTCKSVWREFGGGAQEEGNDWPVAQRSYVFVF